MRNSVTGVVMESMARLQWRSVGRGCGLVALRRENCRARLGLQMRNGSGGAGWCSFHQQCTGWTKLSTVNAISSWESIFEEKARNAERVQDFLETLSESQRASALSRSKVTRVIAGPGSGKTRVLIARVADLMTSGTSPENLLLLTFTNKAAKEMRSRLNELFDKEKTRFMWIGTFHWTATKILQKHVWRLKDGRTSKFHIIDQTESQSILLELYMERDAIQIFETDSDELKKVKKKQNNALKKELREKAKTMQGRIANAKEKRLTVHGVTGRQVFRHVARGPPNESDCANFCWSFDQYQKKLVELNLFDFGDLVGCCVWLLLNDADVLQEYKERFQYICVDEMQDTNKPQYKFLHLLSSDQTSGKSTWPTRGNLFAVGDPNQAIYKFRGAEKGHMMKTMHEDFPHCMSMSKLLENYRSAPHIVRSAEAILDRFVPGSPYGKEMDVIREPSRMQSEVQTATLASDHDEAKYVAEEIQRLADTQNVPLEEMAVVYRQHALSRNLEKELIKRSIDHYVVGVPFWQRSEIKDIVGYLRFLSNPMDSLAFERIHNRPTRGIGDTSYSNLKTWCKLEGLKFPSFLVADLMDFSSTAETVEEVEIPELEIPKSAKIAKKARSGLQELRRLFVLLRSVAREGTVRDVIQRVRDDVGYDQYISPDSLKCGPTELTKLQNLDSLRDLASDGQEEAYTGAGLEALELFVREVSLVDAVSSKKGDGVQLMTAHVAKGLEFTVVFIVGCEHGIFPSWDTQDIAEEARLMFVAMTRAKECLYVTSAENRFHNGKALKQRPSCFVLSLNRTKKTKNDCIE